MSNRGDHNFVNGSFVEVEDSAYHITLLFIESRSFSLEICPSPHPTEMQPFVIREQDYKTFVDNTYSATSGKKIHAVRLNTVRIKEIKAGRKNLFCQSSRNVAETV
jgi:hypothetical protein